MLAATESRLGAIAAGTVTPIAGMKALNGDLVNVVRTTDFALNESRQVTITCVKGSRELKVTRTGVEAKCPPGYTKK